MKSDDRYELAWAFSVLGFFVLFCALAYDECANGEARLASCEQAIVYCAEHRGSRCSRLTELCPGLRVDR